MQKQGLFPADCLASHASPTVTLRNTFTTTSQALWKPAASEERAPFFIIQKAAGPPSWRMKCSNPSFWENEVMLGGETERHKQGGVQVASMKYENCKLGHSCFSPLFTQNKFWVCILPFHVLENTPICPISLKNHSVAQRASSQVTKCMHWNSRNT